MSQGSVLSQAGDRVPGSGRPLSELVVPGGVQRLLDGRPARCVWENELGGLTFEIGAPAASQFVKWTPHASGIDLAAEAARLTWASSYVRVPCVLDTGTDDAGSWLVTSAVSGTSAVSERWRAEPRTAVVAIARG